MENNNKEVVEDNDIKVKFHIIVPVHKALWS